MRSLATRDFGSEISAALPDVVAACKAAGFDLVIVETSGIGQGDAAIVPHVDVPMYVMTPEFGAASQLEKIDMLDFADLVAINKFDRKGAEDALRDVRKQWRRNRLAFSAPDDEVPVFPTVASRFADPGVTRAFEGLCRLLGERAGRPDLLAFGKRPLAPDEPPRLVADVGRLSRDLGFFPKYRLEAGLAQTLDWWRNEHHV